MSRSFRRGELPTLVLVCILAIISGASLSTTGSPAGQTRAARASKGATAVAYECPMHPEVTSKRRGKCPKCGMTLRARSKSLQPTATTGDDSNTAPNPTARTQEIGIPTLRIPDAAVVDQNGRRFNFYTDLVKGKTVIINFIFTTCTNICPSLTATFRGLQQDLGERAGRDVQLISISVDPTTDVPERLKEYSARFKAGPGWTFVTGSKAEIDVLLKALGAMVATKTDHTPMVLIGNDDASYWTRTYGLSPRSALLKTVNEAVSRNRGLNQTIGASATPRSEGSARPIPPVPGGSEGNNSNAGSSSSGSGKYFPNHILLTQDNKPVHFYDDLLKGKVALINFLFTTCQGVCSPMTANLARVQSYLTEHLGREVVMISISVDPLTDTPKRLKTYADKFKIKPGWYFLTGKKENVEWVLYKLGGYVEDKQTHSGILIIGNEATGEWMKVHAMANPTEIASAVTKLLAAKSAKTNP